MKKNYLKNFGVLAASLFIALSATAAEVGELLYPEDNVIYEVTSPTTVKVIGFTKAFATPEFAFPETITAADVTYTVTSIEKFIDNTVIKKLTIPGTVNEIKLDWQGIKGATNLETVIFKEGFTTLAKGAFQNCKSLQTVVLPTGVKEIPAYVFQNCTSLASIVLPNTVTNVAAQAFSGCTSLEKIVSMAGVPPTFEKEGLPEGLTLGVPETAFDAYDTALGDIFDYIEVDAEATTNIQTALAPMPTVRVEGRNVVVAGAYAKVAVYTAAGTQVGNVSSVNGHAAVWVPYAGIYIVKADNHSFKILVR